MYFVFRFLIVLFWSVLCFGQNHDLLSKSEKIAYDKTMELCGSYDFRSLKGRASLFTSSFEEAGLLASLIDVSAQQNFRQIQVAHELETLLNSTGFYKAVEVCFTDDLLARDLFFLTLVLPDLSGKILSWVSDVSWGIFMRACYFSFKTLRAFNAGVDFGSRILWARAVFHKAMKTNLFSTRISEPGVWAIIIGSLGFSAHNSSRFSKLEEAYQDEINDVEISELSAQNRAFKILLQKEGLSANQRRVLQANILNNENRIHERIVFHKGRQAAAKQ